MIILTSAMTLKGGYVINQPLLMRWVWLISCIAKASFESLFVVAG